MAGLQAVLLITGAWHVPQHYRKVIQALEEREIRTICPLLPTNNNVVPPDRSLEDDLESIRDIVREEKRKGTCLTVVAHSYGGVIATAALGEFAVDKDAPLNGGVAAIVFVAAFIPFEGQSLAGIFGGKLPPYLSPGEKNTLVWSDPIGKMYNDLPGNEAQEADQMRVAHSYEAQHSPIDVNTPAAWRKIPTNYLICENDQALPPFVQEMMIAKVREQGISVREFRCSSGHSPFLSQPEVLADIISQVITTLATKQAEVTNRLQV